MNNFIPYGHQWISEEEIRAVTQVLRGDWLTQGPAVEAFEAAVALAAGARHAVAFSSGTAALHGAYFAAGVGPGDEVLTSPLTFVATANAALYLGGEARFADIDPATGCLDPRKVREALSPRTRVIAPVSYAGYPAPMGEFLSLAREVGALVVEDASHALGGTREGRPVGAEADLTVFSFHPVKHVTTGEGGMVTTDRDDLAARLRRFRSHGIEKAPEALEGPCEGPWYYEMQDLGYNYRLTDLQCALGLGQMGRLEGFVARRRELAARYDEAFGSVPGVQLPPRHPGHAYHLYPLRVEPAWRRALFEGLRRRELGVQVHYIPVPAHPFYRKRYGLAPGAFPQAERFYASEISIPLFPALSDPQQDDVIRRIQEGLREAQADRKRMWLKTGG